MYGHVTKPVYRIRQDRRQHIAWLARNNAAKKFDDGQYRPEVGTVLIDRRYGEYRVEEQTDGDFLVLLVSADSTISLSFFKPSTEDSAKKRTLKTLISIAVLVRLKDNNYTRFRQKYNESCFEYPWTCQAF